MTTIRTAGLAATLILIGGMAAAQGQPRLAEPVVVDIPELPLNDALKQLARQAGFQVVFYSRESEGIRAPKLAGRYTAEAALSELLAGTSLTYEFVNANTVAIRAGKPIASMPAEGALRLARAETSSARPGNDAGGEDDVLQEVAITVYGRGSETRMRDVPQAVTVFGKEMLESTGTVELRDVVRFIPSSATSTAYGSVVPQRVNSRGFATTFAINGNAATSPLVAPDTAGLERVEVLMGPASVLYGSMEPGAVINMVTKKPRREHHFSGELEMGSYAWKRATADLGGPLSDRIRGRLNVAYETKETFYDNWRRDRTFVAPVVEFGLTESTSLTLEAWYARFEDNNGAYDRRLPVQGMLLPNPNGKIAENLSAIVPGLSDYYRQAYNYSAKMVHEFGDNWSLTGTAIYDLSSRKGIIWGTSFAINPSLLSVRRDIARQDEEQPTYFGNVSLRGELGTGAVAHNLIMGVDYFDTKFEGLSASARVSDLSLFGPSSGSTVVPALSIHNKILTKSKGVFVQDRAKIGAKLDFLVGLRWSEIESTSARSTLPAELPPLTGIQQDKISTQFGVLYDVTDAATLYASRVTSFVPRGGTTAGGTAFAPEIGIQYEVGAKFDLGGSGLTGNVALYQIEKPNVLTPDLANPGFDVSIGKARSRGFELSLGGRPAPGLLVQTAYGFMDTEAEGGFELRHAPRNTLTLFSRYDVQSGALRGFGISGALQYRDKIFPGPAEGLQFPSYTRVDLGFHYLVSERLEFDLNVKNATDEKIWDSDGPNWIALGEGRTFVAGMKLALR